MISLVKSKSYHTPTFYPFKEGVNTPRRDCCLVLGRRRMSFDPDFSVPGQSSAQGVPLTINFPSVQ
jgi:hypothetical protein